MGSPWRLIKTAPKDGTAILVSDGLNPATAVCWIARYKLWAMLGIDGQSVDGPTHWMPLPELPSKEGHGHG